MKCDQILCITRSVSQSQPSRIIPFSQVRKKSKKFPYATPQAYTEPRSEKETYSIAVNPLYQGLSIAVRFDVSSEPVHQQLMPFQDWTQRRIKNQRNAFGAVSKNDLEMATLAGSSQNIKMNRNRGQDHCHLNTFNKITK